MLRKCLFQNTGKVEQTIKCERVKPFKPKMNKSILNRFELCTMYKWYGCICEIVWFYGKLVLQNDECAVYRFQLNLPFSICTVYMSI